MSQEAYIRNPIGPDLYETVPATAGPNSMTVVTYLGQAWSWFEAGVPAVIKSLPASGTIAAQAAVPSLKREQAASVGDWLVPIDANHDGTCDDIVLVRQVKQWRTIADDRRAFVNGVNTYTQFQGQRVRFVCEFSGCEIYFLVPQGGLSLEWSGNTMKHDGTGSYRHVSSVAVGGWSSIFGLAGSGMVEGEAVKRSDGRWTANFHGFLNVHTDNMVSNMGGDYWAIEGRIVWSGSADPVFGFHSGDNDGAISFIAEAKD